MIDEADQECAEETEAQEEQANQEEQPEEQPKDKSANELTKVDVSEKGFLVAKSLEGRFRIASAFFQAGMVPKGYKNPTQVLAGMEYAAELNLRPLTGLKNIAVINGNPSLWGDLPLGLCRKHPQFEYIEEKVFDKDYNIISFENKNLNAEAWGAVCYVKRKDRDKPRETFFTLDDAKKAGLLGRDNVWKTYPRRMLQMRARSQNLKDSLPEVLSGVTIAEYDYNVLPGGPEMRDVNYQGEDKINPAMLINESLND